MIRFSICLGLYLLAFQLIAQNVINAGSTISIQGSQFTVGEDLTNNGTIINNGNLLISGAWINNGTYDPGIGQITFNSNHPQIINHNDQAFKRLTVSGGGEKRFLANITIEDELVLQDGNLFSENGARIIFQQDAMINGGSDQSHIVGPVEQQGKGQLLFPIGNGTTYLPVEITGINDESTKITLRLHELTAGETLSGGIGITKLSTKRYWEMNTVEGSLSNSLLTLPLRDETNFPADNTLLAIGISEVALGPYNSIGQSAFVGDQNNGVLTSENEPSKTFFTVVSLSAEKNIVAYNGVSVYEDGLNDFFRILNIEYYPANNITIFNRWGDKVFDLSGYDNKDRVFKGENNLKGGEKLPSGIYFYKIHLGDGSKEITGYLEVKN